MFWTGVYFKNATENGGGSNTYEESFRRGSFLDQKVLV